LTGVFCAQSLGGVGFGDGIDGIGQQLGVQFLGVLSTVIYTGIVSFIILKILDVTIGLRVSEELETEGLDLALHDERGYNW
jgi:Amt family ammonium transporter